MEEENWADVVEAAAKEAFEAQWEEFLHEDFDPWKKEVVLKCYIDAFLEGAIFCANTSSDILRLKVEKALEEDEDNESEEL